MLTINDNALWTDLLSNNKKRKDYDMKVIINGFNSKDEIDSFINWLQRKGEDHFNDYIRDQDDDENKMYMNVSLLLSDTKETEDSIDIKVNIGYY